VDAGAALRPAEIEVRLGDWIYTIAALPAADWIEAILSEDVGAIVPGLLEPEDQVDVWREFLRGNVTRAELQNAWRDAIAAASGQPWWQCARLVMSAADRESWPVVHGKLAMRGVDLDRISLGAFYNAVYFMIMESEQDEAKRSELEFRISTPPPGVDTREAMQEMHAADDWSAAFGQFSSFQQGGLPVDPESAA
jgi:hypothetical protein